MHGGRQGRMLLWKELAGCVGRGFCFLCRPLRGLARSHRDCTTFNSCAEPVGAGEPAKAATRFRRSPAG
ncbi:hypothetical protein B8W72_19860 [Pseudomonas putida]|uniref:Uncharacterized protein n=1 Tax=Pseudomonas putida TaxID=303 RepID=A0A1Y3KUX1_PSEPU|nr:hypothetical protein B8W72_19860 [Pseudomonas putida]